MEIIRNYNTDFMNKILELKLERKINKFKNEIYFSVVENNILYGITRLTKLEKKEIYKIEDLLKDLDINPEELSLDVYYLSGLWLDDKFSKKGIRQELSDKRIIELKNIKEDYLIVSEFNNNSTLLPYYKSILNTINISEKGEFTNIVSSRI